MSQKYLNPTTLSPNDYIFIEFDDTMERAVVVEVTDELLEVLVNPNTSEEFYAELYFDNQEDWKVLITKA